MIEIMLIFRGLVLFILIGLISFALVIVLAYLRGTTEPGEIAIFSIIGTALFAILAWLVKPIRLALEHFMLTGIINFKNPKITYLYGASGSGKTSLCLSWKGSSARALSTSTAVFNPWLLKEKKMKILDYRGQSPSQVTTLIEDKYIKNWRGEINISAALFIVDFVPAQDDKGIPLETLDAQVSWLGKVNSEENIVKRVREHEDYIQKSAIDIIFSVIRGSKLKCIVLVINKIDVFREALNKGYIKTPVNISDDEYAISFFKKIENELNTARREYGIQYFGVKLISATQDINTRDLLNTLLSECEK